MDSTKFSHKVYISCLKARWELTGLFLLEIKAIVLMTVLLAKYSHKKWADSPKICVHSTQITLLESLGYKRYKIQKYFIEDISENFLQYFQVTSTTNFMM